ncbi:MAG: alpha/beta hydrolase [Arenicella sp.]|nr:alpha/beta hydrolase [Arenicella sp.]
MSLTTKNVRSKTQHSVKSVYVDTPRLRQHALVCGEGKSEVVLFVHGNLSSCEYYRELMLSLADTHHCIAVDLRGYGDTEPVPLDATRGVSDWSEDLAELLQAMKIDRVHVMGWSAGAAAVMQLAIDQPELATTITLVAPISPFGFGGTKDNLGTLTKDDCAGSGGGLISPELIRLIEAGDLTTEFPESPLNLLRTLYVKEPFRFSREKELLEATLKQKLGVQFYPGDHVESPNWPFVTPGKWGAINAVSPKYFDLSSFADLAIKPPVLWVRGASDLIVSDHSLCDVAVLGQLGVVPDWSENLDFPPQPMVSQTRHVLELYKSLGGAYHEVVFQDVGHSPFLEAEERFLGEFLAFLNTV